MRNVRVAGVIGQPIAHSMSPALHNFWFQTFGIKGSYVPLEVSAEHLAEVVPALGKAGFLGLNVTIPHKSAVLACIDEADTIANLTGAANTLLFRDDGSIFGTNTDGAGFLNNLMDQAPGFEPAKSKALIIGAGGAARAIAFALASAGVQEIGITNRDQRRAELMIEDLAPSTNCQFRQLAWRDRHELAAAFSVVVNSTAAGMSGKPDLDVSLSKAMPDTIVADIVYNPLQTTFLAAAKERGLQTVDGLGMLLHQAVVGFQHWGGKTPAIDQKLRKFMIAQLGL